MVNFLYQWVFYVFIITVVVTFSINVATSRPEFDGVLISLAEIGVGGMMTVLIAIPMVPILFWLRGAKKKCRWLDPNSTPDQWELPSLARDRARLNRPDRQ